MKQLERDTLVNLTSIKVNLQSRIFFLLPVFTLNTLYLKH